MSYLTSLTRATIKQCITLTIALCGVVTLGCQAQTSTKPIDSIDPIKPAPELQGTTYSVTRDYRKCAFPLCGGWHLTPVNQYSLHLQTEDEAYESSALLPNTIYVAYINYKRLGLNEKQIAELEAAMPIEHVLLRGTVTSESIGIKPATRTKTLVVNGAWVGANKNPPVGPYLNITSTGIVCITTPCPYFKAAVINTNYASEIHGLDFEKASLDPDQQTRAWEAVSTTGLIVTGTRYQTIGFDETGAEPGKGVGVAATKVFFPYPAKR